MLTTARRCNQKQLHHQWSEKWKPPDRRISKTVKLQNSNERWSNYPKQELQTGLLCPLLHRDSNINKKDFKNSTNTNNASQINTNLNAVLRKHDVEKKRRGHGGRTWLIHSTCLYHFRSNDPWVHQVALIVSWKVEQEEGREVRGVWGYHEVTWGETKLSVTESDIVVSEEIIEGKRGGGKRRGLQFLSGSI